jgi:hypothetical protein
MARAESEIVADAISALEWDHTTEQRDRLIVLLDDAIAIIEASDDPDCRAWLTQAHATLDQVRL